MGQSRSLVLTLCGLTLFSALAFGADTYKKRYNAETGRGDWVNATIDAANVNDLPGSSYPGAGIAKSTGSAWDTSIADYSANWNTAYGWGDHASGGYLKLDCSNDPLTASLNIKADSNGSSTTSQFYINGLTQPLYRLWFGYDTTNNFAFINTGNATGYGTLALCNLGGQVGIGTAAPTIGSKLDIQGGSLQLGDIAISNTNEDIRFTHAGVNGVFRMLPFGNDCYYENTYAGDIWFRTNTGTAANAIIKGVNSTKSVHLFGTLNTDYQNISLTGLNRVSNASAVGAIGLYWDYNAGALNTEYAIYKTAGTWSAPDYQQLDISFNTGIVLDPGSLYGRSYVSIPSGGLRLQADNLKEMFGAADDSSIYYDATNLVINPKEVGSGNLNVLGDIDLNANNFYSTGNIQLSGASSYVYAKSATFAKATPPSDLDYSLAYLRLGSNEYGTNSYRMIAFGYMGAQTYAPGYIGYQELTDNNYTYGDLIFLTKPDDGNTAPVERLRIKYNGSILVPADSQKILWGAGNDASVYYDGTNMVINPKEVGTGILDVLGTLKVDAYQSSDGTAGASATTGGLTFKDGLYTSGTASSSSVGANVLINGGMNVWQRGATFTTPNDDTYGPDRWNFLSDGNGAWTFSQSTDVPTGTKYSLKFVNVTANKQCGIVTILENKDSAPLTSQTVSLSFWAKTTTDHAIGNLRATVLSWSSTADAVTSDVVGTWAGAGTDPTFAANWTGEVAGSNKALTTDWAEYKIENISIDTASTANVAVVIWVDDTTITAADEFYISNVKLEVGATATDFEYRPIGQELALCQRYFESNLLYGNAASDGVNYALTNHQMVCQVTGGTNVNVINYFQTQKRAVPTMAYYSTTAVASPTAGRWAFLLPAGWTEGTGVTTNSMIGQKAFTCNIPTTGQTFGQAVIAIGAWTADAEL